MAFEFEGRDKLTLVLAPELAPLGGWLEQLVAEGVAKRTWPARSSTRRGSSCSETRR